MVHRLHHALPIAGGAFAKAWRADGAASLTTTLLAERERWMLWLPVAFGLGVAIYFSLSSEPPAWLIPLVLPLTCLVFARLWYDAYRDKGPAPAAGLALGTVLLLLGFGVAQYRTFQVDAPVIERRGAYQVEGEILLVEPKIKGERLLLGDIRLTHAKRGDLLEEATPKELRFTRRSADPPLHPGDRIEARVMLMPPSAPSEPHGFDFARRAFFEQLGAVGYSLSAPVLLERAEGWRVATALASLRQHLAAEVGALIAVYETGVGRPPAGAAGLDWRLLMYVVGVILTTVIASTATAPLAVYHFNRLPTFSILANVVAVPLTAFWIMPLGLLGMLLLPFGLADWCLLAMGWGIDAMLDVAAWTASIPGAVIMVPRPPLSSFVLILLGGLWLALWKTGWRQLGLAPVFLGLLLAAIHRQPDLLIDARGLLIAARVDDDRLALSSWKKDSWVTEGWLRGAGQEEAAPWPEEGRLQSELLRCDILGCIYRRAGHRIAFTRHADALPEDCARNDLVIGYPRIETCMNGTPLIGPNALRASGGLAFWLEPGRIERRSVRDVRGDRPWAR